MALKMREGIMGDEELGFRFKSNFKSGDIKTLNAALSAANAEYFVKIESFDIALAKAEEYFEEIEFMRPLRIKEAVRALYKEIACSRDNGRTWVELAQILTEKGCKVHWKTLEKAFLAEAKLWDRLHEATDMLNEAMAALGKGIKVELVPVDEE